MDGFLAKVQALIQAERHSFILFVPVMIGLGTALYFSLADEPPLWAGLSALLLCVLEGFSGWKIAAVKYAVLIIELVSLGFTAAQMKTLLVQAPVLKEETKPVTLEARIIDLNQTERALQIILDQVKIKDFDSDVPRKIRVSVRKKPDAAIGDHVTALAILRPPTMPNYPGGYDFARDNFFKGIGAIGFVLGDIKKVETITAPSSVAIRLENARQNINRKIAEALPSRPVEQSIVQALLSGEASSIPDSASDSLRNSGLYHIISISGLHISFVAGMVFLLVRFLLILFPYTALHWPTKKIAAIAAIIAIVTYTVLVGAPVPTQRSTLMAGLVLFAILIDRSALSLRLVAFAATVILLLEPESLLSASFQMSFAAVTALVSVYVLLHTAWREKLAHSGWIGRTVFYSGEIILTSLVAGLATMPFVIFHFQNTQLYGVLANMVGVPLTGFITMPLGLLSYVLMLFGLEVFALHWMGQSIAWLLQWSDWIAALPGAVLRMPAAPPVALPLFALGFLWICLWNTHMRWLGAVPIIAGFLTIPFQPLPDIIIAPSGKVIAVRLEDGHYAFQRRDSEEFFSDSWLRRMGQAESVEWPKSGNATQNLACDKSGCIVKRDEVAVAIIYDSAAFFEECGVSGIIINNSKRTLNCPPSNEMRPKIIETRSLEKTGTAAVFLKPVFRIQDVQDVRGNRPWVNNSKGEK